MPKGKAYGSGMKKKASAGNGKTKNMGGMYGGATKVPRTRRPAPTMNPNLKSNK